MNQENRVGVRWTKTEEDELLQEINELSKEQIALKHRRKLGGITSRLKKIGYDMFLQGKDTVYICSKIKIPEEEFNSFVESMKQKKPLEKNKQPEQANLCIQKDLSEIKEQLKQLNNHLGKLVEILSK